MNVNVLADSIERSQFGIHLSSDEIAVVVMALRAFARPEDVRTKRYERALAQIANMHTVTDDRANRITLIAAAETARAALNDSPPPQLQRSCSKVTRSPWPCEACGAKDASKCDKLTLQSGAVSQPTTEEK